MAKDRQPFILKIHSMFLIIRPCQESPSTYFFFNEEDQRLETLRRRTLSTSKTHKMGMENPHKESPHTGQGSQDELMRTLVENRNMRRERELEPNLERKRDRTL